jgi:hypothetical protein
MYRDLWPIDFSLKQWYRKENEKFCALERILEIATNLTHRRSLQCYEPVRHFCNFQNLTVFSNLTKLDFNTFNGQITKQFSTTFT